MQAAAIVKALHQTHQFAYSSTPAQRTSSFQMVRYERIAAPLSCRGPKIGITSLRLDGDLS